MRRTILTLLGSAVLVTATAQFALAAQHHQGRKLHRAPVATGERVPHLLHRGDLGSPHELVGRAQLLEPKRP